MQPDWFGNPKHFVAGAILAAVVALLSPRFSIQSVWIAAALAIGVTMTVEGIVELVEYPLKYEDDPNLTAYYDTLADLAGSLAGAVVGAALGIGLRGRLLFGKDGEPARPGELQARGVAMEDPGASRPRVTRRSD